MRICLAMLDSADAIALLPTWAHSGGAKIELALAEYTGKQVIHTWMIAGGGAEDRPGMEGDEDA